jgi:prophage regulatory protein
MAPPASPYALLRVPAVLLQVGIGKSTLYRRIQNRLFPRPVQLGGNIVGWPAAEVEAVNKARIAGASDAEIKALVERLHANRQAQKAAA